MEVMYEDGAYPLYKKHPTDAGWDLAAKHWGTIPAYGSRVISTGVRVAVPVGFKGEVTVRSGQGFKHDLIAHVGTIDSDYRGEVKLKIFNLSGNDYEFEAGDRLCQLCIIPINTTELEIVTKLSDTVRGEGGFNSTGIKQ